jgi:hypothetical protein
MSTLPALLERPFLTTEDVASALTRLEQFFLERRDRRGVFASAYLTITLALQDRIGEGIFLDNAWVASYLVCFANFYREALRAHERGDRSAVPKAWWISLQTSAKNRGLLLQDLLLGINAHINFDLPFALIAATIDPDREVRQSDHFAVNEVLKSATNDLQMRVIGLYAPILALLDESFGELDERITHFNLEKARQACWAAAINLANAQSESQRDLIRKDLNDRTAVLASLMLYPEFPLRRLWSVLRIIERFQPWPQLLAAPRPLPPGDK